MSNIEKTTRIKLDIVMDVLVRHSRDIEMLKQKMKEKEKGYEKEKKVF